MDSSKSGDDFNRQLIALIPQLRAFGRSLCRDPAEGEDLAQETMTKALFYRDRFVMGTNMKAWTFMILRNLFYSDKRRSWRSQPLLPEVAESIPAVTNADSRLELDELRRALALLAPDQREALVLVGAGGLSYEQTAEITGVAVGTVKSRVSRARSLLAQLVEAGEGALDSVLPSGAMASIFSELDDYRKPLHAA